MAFAVPATLCQYYLLLFAVPAPLCQNYCLPSAILCQHYWCQHYLMETNAGTTTIRGCTNSPPRSSRAASSMSLCAHTHARTQPCSYARTHTQLRVYGRRSGRVVRSLVRQWARKSLPNVCARACACMRHVCDVPAGLSSCPSISAHVCASICVAHGMGWVCSRSMGIGCSTSSPTTSTDARVVHEVVCTHECTQRNTA